MLVDKLDPVPKERVEFSLSRVICIPDKTGCYALTSHDNVILYIGKGHLAKRIDAHLNNREKKGMTPHGKVYWFYYIECLSYEMNQLESGWINQHKIVEGIKPYLNKIDPPA